MDPVALDARLTVESWTRLPPGTVRDSFLAPSGELARMTLGPPHGRRVLLVSGATGSKEDFLLMMPLLAKAGYRAESYDMAGQFESAAAGPERLTPPAERYEMSLFVDDLLVALQDGPTPAHVLGYSFAGTVAAVAATTRPDLFASLTLLTTPPLSGQVFEGLKRIGRLSRRADPRLAAALMYRGIMWNLTRMDPVRRQFIRERLPHTRRSSVVDIMGLMMRTPELREPLRRSPFPILVATGTGDLWPASTYREFADAIDAEFVCYETGHSPCETTPHQLVADMCRLFDRVDSP